MMTPGNFQNAAAQQAAAQNQLYGYDVGNYNSMMGGLYGIGSMLPYFLAV